MVGTKFSLNQVLITLWVWGIYPHWVFLESHLSCYEIKPITSKESFVCMFSLMYVTLLVFIVLLGTDVLVHNNFHTQEYVCLLCGFFHTRFFHHHAWNVCHVKGNEKMALKHWDKRKKKPSKQRNKRTITIELQIRMPHKTSSLRESPSNLILCMKQLCAILLLLRSFITPKGQLQKKKERTKEERRQMPH